MVRVYMNVKGLTKKLLDIGFLPNEDSLRQFATGFTQNQALFDIVDAGRGKERADHKIREAFGIFMNNMHCKHIIFGAAHDNGYVPVLDQYAKNHEAASRITLLRSVRLGREYISLPFHAVHFPSVFRDKDLPEPKSFNKQVKMVSLRQKESHPNHLDKTQNGFVAHSQALLEKPVFPGPIFLNRSNERVDGPLGECSPEAWASLVNRISKQKLCNEYHLLGSCFHQMCPYSHDPPLASEQLLALAKKARQTRCFAGPQCRSGVCYSGHSCPHQPNCPKGTKCFFKGLHHIDQEIVKEHEIQA